jgi:pyrimidine-specific ribonucleoside hydrolase
MVLSRRSRASRALGALFLIVAVAAGATAAVWTEASASSRAKVRPVVIDTDMSVDDWMAILFLLHRRDVSVKAITVSGTGVAHGAAGARNAIRLLDLEGRRDIPVAYGRGTTYPGGHAFPVDWRPALDNMLGIGLPRPSRTVSHLSAAELIANVATRSPVDILELGPPTDVADALRATPGLEKQITSITLMSGALNVAGTAPGKKADWNFYVDPVAARIVLQSEIPWTLVPLDATNAVPYNDPFFNRLAANRKTAAARFVYQALSRQMPGRGLYFWDPLAAAVLVDPSVATLGRRTIRIVTAGADAGRTVEARDGTRVRVALAGKQARFEALFLAGLSTSAAASTKPVPKPVAAPRWVNDGPEGGWLAQVAIHPERPQVVYARSWFGLFRSADGGVSWTRVAAPRYLSDVALDPDDPQIGYAVAEFGIYRTTDGGARWARLPVAPDLQVAAVTASPSPPHVIYALSIHSGGRREVRLWSSSDDGEIWKQGAKIEAARDWEPAAVLADPARPGTVYARVPRGVFRSTDGGASWARASAGLPVGKLSSLAVDPARSGALYAGTRNGDVFRSTDYGKSWTKAARGLDGEVTGIAVSAADGSVYAGTSPPSRTDAVEIGGGAVYRSADGRGPWRRGGRGLAGWHVEGLAADATTPGRALAATEQGIFVTRDGGSTWAERVHNLVAPSVAGLAVDPADPRVAFAAVARGIVVSRDGGRTWGSALDVRGKHAGVGPLLAVSGRPETIYAVRTSYAAPKAGSTLLASRDAGRTWATVAALPVPIGALVADPSRPATLYGIGAYCYIGAYHCSPFGGILKSGDAGRSWRQVYSADRKTPVRALAVDPHDPNVLYAGLVSSWEERRPLLKSEDGGRTWRRIRAFEPGPIWALATDPRSRGTLYAVGDMGLEVGVSRDGGRTWSKLGRLGSETTSLLVDPVRPVVYAATSEGVYVMTGGSPSWRAAGPAGRTVQWLAVDSKARRLYAGTVDGGVAATRLPFAR